MKAPSSLGPEETASLSLTIEAAAGAVFSMRISSQMNLQLDESLQVFNNDVMEIKLPAPTPGYIEFKFFAAPGRSTIRWIYNSGDGGEGDVWVDNIVISPSVADGFESGDFTLYPWIVDDGWIVDETKPFDGLFSAHFPVNETNNVPWGESRNLTIPVDTLRGGKYSFATIPQIQMPYDRMGVYLDDVSVQQYFTP